MLKIKHSDVRVRVNYYAVNIEIISVSFFVLPQAERPQVFFKRYFTSFFLSENSATLFYQITNHGFSSIQAK
jgi:hypothetical protein